MYSSASFPPKGANRGHYVNARVDALLAQAAAETGRRMRSQARRRAEYVEVQKILADELPSDPAVVSGQRGRPHRPPRKGWSPQGDGNFDFLR